MILCRGDRKANEGNKQDLLLKNTNTDLATILQEFYQITFRKKLYSNIEMLQNDLDEWIDFYNNKRTHQGKMCCGGTPLETLIEGNKSGRKSLFNKLELTVTS